MGCFYSLLSPSRLFKRLSSAIANTSHRGGAATGEQHRTTSHTTQTDDREECENPSYGYSCHEVFLSHSGHQKSFVEQLFVDLQRENISCFFDKDSQSLPKGENFPTRIFEAAQKCTVGVVVLSDEFISSKWPMEELCTFVRAQNSTNPKLKILPLFFGLTPQSLSEKLQKKDSLKRSWQKLLKSQKRPTNLDEWVSALETLRRINGLNYFEQEGEVAYRAQIVRAIRSLVRPKLPYDESSVQGKERLCQMVARLFNNTPCGEHGVKIGGLYGVAGIGKTTLARIACNFYSNDFDGRVLHVELGKGIPVERLKCALQNLTDASKTLVKSVTDVEQGWWLFNQRMRGRKVFLALDNISDLPGPIEEARRYLGAVCSAGNQSTILLMARSSAILRRFIPKGEGWCMHVPSLEEEEAIAVLLQLTPLKGSKLSSEEREIAQKCALKCYFHWHCKQYHGYDVPYSAYHPLALRVLGALLCQKFNSCSDLSQCIEIQNLTKPWRCGHMPEEIFSILEESFRHLRKDCREIFMLLCLYLPQSCMTSEAAFSWLALAYDREVEDIKLAMDELKRQGFVEIMMESSHQLYIHDLHIEFAENKADGTGKWISVKGRRHIPASLQEALSSDRPRFLAMKFENCHFECPGFVNDELFSNVLVLHLQNMPQLKLLNLSPMRIVRSITIVGCGGMQEIRGLEILTSLVYFVVKGCSTNVEFSGMERLLALQHLQIEAKLPERITESSPLSWTSFPPSQGASVVGTSRLDHIEKGTRRLDLTACSKLRTIKLTQCDMVYIDLTGCLELREIEIVDCKNLREISLFGPSLAGLETQAICSTLKSKSLPRLGPGSETQAIFPNLSELRLMGLHNLEKLPNHIGLTGLRILELERMHSLKELPTLTGLSALQKLSLVGMHSLKEFPTLTKLTALYYLKLEGMHSLKELPTLTGLTALEMLNLEGMHSLKELPTLTGLTKLWDLRLKGMHSLKELPTVTGLTALKYLKLEGMHSLKELPTLTGLTKLQGLDLVGMHRLKELPTLTGLTALYDLKLEGMNSLKELPALTGLTKLQTLHLVEMNSLKELPTLTELTALNYLKLEGMHSLKELPILTGLTSLYHLRLKGMHSLEELPTLTGLTALQWLCLVEMHGLKELPTLTGLTALQWLCLVEMHSLKELPTLTGLTALKNLVLMGMHSLEELPTLTELTALESIELKGMQSLRELPTLTGFNNCVDIDRMLYSKSRERLAQIKQYYGIH